MTTPSTLHESLHEPEFWARYTYAYADGPGADRLGELEDWLDDDEDEEDDDDDSSFDVAFEVGAGHHVVLSIDVWADSYSLGVTVPGLSSGLESGSDADPDSDEPAELGWDDLAHWHPHALRWSELDVIVRAITASNPAQWPPGAALALLCRFAAVFDDDDVDGAVAAVEQAYAGLRPETWEGYWPRGTDWLERADFRGKGVTWQSDEAGNRWVAERDADVEPFYSTRLAPDPEADGGFPHGRLRAVLDAAAVTVGEQAEPGSN
ncbi:hypothetical protein ACIGB8_01395 [Promicromonospora sukumoe]|uniref:hypothetical protein n=1 Tax=Promicromonospora sukumoe TaxID=88382 RepID=UPI0037C5FD18